MYDVSLLSAHNIFQLSRLASIYRYTHVFQSDVWLVFNFSFFSETYMTITASWLIQITWPNTPKIVKSRRLICRETKKYTLVFGQENFGIFSLRKSSRKWEVTIIVSLRGKLRVGGRWKWLWIVFNGTFLIGGVDSRFTGYAFLASQKTGAIFKQDAFRYCVNLSFNVARKQNGYLLLIFIFIIYY